MKELSEEELEAVLKAPQPKPRKSKKIERTYRDWFYSIRTELGACDNPECLDDRGKSLIHVWMHPSGINMCRFCWLVGWLGEE